MKRFHYFILPVAFCFSVFVAVYVQYQLPAVAGPLMTDLNLSPAEYTSIFSGPLIPSIALSVLAGVLADRYGLMLVVTVGGFVAVLGGILRVFSRSYIPLLLAMILMGVLPTLLNVNVSKMLRSIYSAEDIPKKLGVFYGCSMLGMALGTGTSALFPGYSSAFIFGGVLLCMALIFLVAAWKRGSTGHSVIENANVTIIPARDLLRNLKILRLGIILAFVMAGSVALSGFLPDELSKRGIAPAAASGYATVYLIGNIASTLFLPRLAEKITLRRTAVLAALISAAGAACVLRLPTGILLGTGLFLLGLFSNGMIPLCMSLPVRYRDIGPTGAGSACGILNTMQMIGGVVIPSYVLAPLANGNGTRLFISCAVLYGAVAVLSLFLKDAD